MLGRKQSISNDEWLETVKNIAEIISEDELHIIVENTKEKIQAITCNKKAAFAWSECGTHPWPARQWTKNIENGWSEILDIEPNLIKAKKYLEG